MKDDFKISGMSGWGAEVELSEETCSAECWAFLNRTDEEMKLSMEEWQSMYRKRVADGQSSKAI